MNGLPKCVDKGVRQLKQHAISVGMQSLDGPRQRASRVSGWTHGYLRYTGTITEGFGAYDHRSIKALIASV